MFFFVTKAAVVASETSGINSVMIEKHVEREIPNVEANFRYGSACLSQVRRSNSRSSGRGRAVARFPCLPSLLGRSVSLIRSTKSNTWSISKPQSVLYCSFVKSLSLTPPFSLAFFSSSSSFSFLFFSSSSLLLYCWNFVVRVVGND